MSSALVVIKHVSAADKEGTKYHVVNANENGTVAELRSALERSGIITARDIFQGVNKSSEGFVNVAKAKKDGFVRVDVGASSASERTSAAPSYTFEDPKGIYELTPSQLALVGKYAQLGTGMTLSNFRTPASANRSVIKPVDTGRLQFLAADAAYQDVKVFYTEAAAAHFHAGWHHAEIRGALDTYTGGVKGGIDLSSHHSSSEVSEGSILYVAGRLALPHCTVTLPINGLEPHPDFEKAIWAALKNPQPRTALDRVFSDWGHIFVSSVEMGGVKSSYTEEVSYQQESMSHLHTAMSVTLSKRFGLAGDAEAAASSAELDNSVSRLATSFGAMSFDTIGGIPALDDVRAWSNSVGQYQNWRVTKRLTVEPVINLFNPTIRKLIRDVYRLPTILDLLVDLIHLADDSGIHLYTSNEEERKHAAAALKLKDNGPIARILPNQTGGAVPLLRAWNPITRDNIYTINKEKHGSYAGKDGYVDHGVAGYVFSTPAEGTVPLYEITFVDKGTHAYTTSIADRNEFIQVAKEKALPTGVAGYVFPTNAIPPVVQAISDAASSIVKAVSAPVAEVPSDE